MWLVLLSLLLASRIPQGVESTIHVFCWCTLVSHLVFISVQSRRHALLRAVQVSDHLRCLTNCCSRLSQVFDAVLRSGYLFVALCGFVPSDGMVV